MVPLGLILILAVGGGISHGPAPSDSTESDKPSRGTPQWRGYIDPDRSSGRVRRHRGPARFGRPDTAWMRHVRDSTGRRLIPNWIGTLHGWGTDEPIYSQQWSLENTGQVVESETGLPGADIGAVEAWNLTTGDSNVVVAFVDGGIDVRHPDFFGKLAYNEIERKGVAGKDDDDNGYVDDTLGWDFVRGDAVARDLGGHGSATASLVAAAWDGNGLAGLAPGVRVLPVRVADGGSRVELANLVDGIDYAVSRKAKVVNLSLGGLTATDGIDSAIARAVRSGAVVVASSGNEGVDLDKTPRYPAALTMRGLLVVGASTMRDGLSGYSNYSLKKVHLSAPGDAILAASLPMPATLDQEMFESGLAGWTTGGNSTVNWDVETRNGNTWLSDSPGKLYATSGRSWIRSPKFNADGHSDLVLSMSLRGSVSGSDLFVIEAAPDTSFTTGVDTLFELGSFLMQEPMKMGFDVPQDGRPFHVRFSMSSSRPSSISDSGVMIDSLVLYARDVPQPPAGTFARVWGTSFSAPLVSGALALMLSRNPNASIDSLVAAIKGGAQVVSGLSKASMTGARLWVPGAFARLEKTTRTVPVVHRGPAVASRRGALSVLDAGDWTLELRDLRGALQERVAGKGPREIRLRAGSPVAWSFRGSTGERMDGLVLEP